MKVGSVNMAAAGSAMQFAVSAPRVQSPQPDVSPVISGIEPGIKGTAGAQESMGAARPEIIEEKQGYTGKESVMVRQAGKERRYNAAGEQLGRQELAELTALKQRDRAVRSHEQAHRASGAGLVTGGTTYSFEKGPDNRRYAVGGEVQIDTSRESTPRATILKMSKVKKAALAPADPSAQDRKVAAMADKVMAQARQELNTGNRSHANQQSGEPSIDLIV